MRPSRLRHNASFSAAVAAACALPACLKGEEIDLGRNVDAGAPEASFEAGPETGTVFEASSGSPLLSAGISATKGTICAGSCVDLVATATGGSGPYTFTWGQGLGSGAGPKSVCPVATATYSVLVTSFPSEREATAGAMITVVPCDAGSSSPPVDSGSGTGQRDTGTTPPQASALCVPNPSFEGPPTIGTTGPPGTTPTGAPPQWQVCQGAPDVGPSLSLLPASNGMSYAGLAVGTGSLSYVTASIGATLCSPLVGGTTYSFCLDLGLGVRGVMPPLTMGAAPPVLEIWGGTSACNQDALLWTSPGISNVDTWQNVCGSFVAPRGLSTITLLPTQSGASVGPGTWSYVVVDNVTAGP